MPFHLHLYFNNLDEPKLLSKIVISFSEREIEFLKLVCSEKAYKEIADGMNLSPRTIDGDRDAMFEKLHAKTRVGLVMYAIRNGIVEAI